MGSGGMTNHEVLRAATIFGAEAIGFGDDIGSLAEGKLADILVLDDDPLADLRRRELLLYNGKRNRWKRLAKCEWCGSYFLKKSGSGRPRKYCTDDCTEMADQKLHAPTRQGTDNQREKERNRRRRNREEGKK